MIRKLTSYCLLLFFWALSFNNSSNKHYHISSKGLVVQHSHPYSKSHEHSHSAEELAKFSLFSPHFESFVSLLALPFANVLEWLVLHERQEDLEVLDLTVFSNKSPPVFI